MARQCPICHKPVDVTYKPFCSKRCADIDLGRWLKGEYVVAGSGDDPVFKESLQPFEDDENETR